MKKRLSPYLYFLIATISFLATSANASELSTKLKGKILLQVEDKGKAWYVNPTDEKRYFMGRPDDAFALMRKLGVGITNKDLNKIAINFEGLEANDNDSDGLCNFIEDSYGTDKNKKDTDGDGYNDGDEVKKGFNPSGTGKLNIDTTFSAKQMGKILLQVGGDGEAWYVNPTNKQRYYLGRPADAFNVMRKLGLGVLNNDLNKINSYKQNPKANMAMRNTECDLFADKLDTCTPYKCQFTHPFFNKEKMEKEILGIVNGKCSYVEQMPNNGKMTCNYSEEERKAVSEYYRKSASADSAGVDVKTDSSGNVKTIHTLNGKEVKNPLQEALNNGRCVISGYNDNSDKCPSGKVYKGEMYSYKNDQKITHTVCSDPNMTCPTCENCSSGVFKKVMKIVDEKGQEVCQECMFDSNCKTGYECTDNDKCELKN